ncbi:glycoside hydrolase family 30 protein [Butyrivibrio sp. MC2013]|uniref:glycoside hydrolase family 30 protein n=1 Tax=Butyrivibrio sp. MC2013 TaxID=1280686 RepID=UPI00041844E1|nr:glycoside hydrolase family 30 beta sandwich domain-containing protein [Butyrivibrio sp. MC2013]
MKAYITDDKRRMTAVDIETAVGSAGEMQQVRMHPDTLFQTIKGIGGALTEAAAYTYSQLDDDQKEKFLDLYFGENSSNYNLCRLHIESCDFALGNYAYIEDENDKELASFNMDRDRKYIIPFVKAALKRNPDMIFLASPWSPPAFMKTNGEMNHGGKLKEEYAQMWAEVMVRFVTEYEKEGIRISYITVQNEPAATQTWDSCVYTATEEAVFVRDHLKPALVKAGHSDVKIGIWDHNKELILDRARESFGVEGARDVIDFVAFHWYTGDHFETLQQAISEFPDKEFIFTEGCVEYSRFKGDSSVRHAEMYAHDMIGNFKMGANAFIDWNVLLDKQGGPNHVGNFCDAPVMFNDDDKRLDAKLSYYYIQQLSRFVQKGARRALVSSYNRNLECTGFVNPDGSKVMVCLNESDSQVSFTGYDGRETFEYTSAPHSIVTFVW